MGSAVKQAKQFYGELAKHECDDFEIETILGMVLERLAGNKEDIDVEVLDSAFSKNKYVIVHFKNAGITYLLYVNFDIYDIYACFVFGR
ncbi:MAG TPA: hypothetical protein EYP20_05695 [Aigarchaeota archaeon]|nr:hypothetical protein [Aigarchaeota archaeon]